MTDYKTVFEHSIRAPREFWQSAAEDIIWHQPCEQVLDESDKPFYRWFRGGTLNTCENMVDRHVREGFGEQAAIIYDSAMTGQQQTISYRQLLDEVSGLAGAMRAHGVKHGDRVIIYMPMVPQAVYAMLACARLGAIHSVVFGGFSSKELASRIDDAGADFIFSASCGLEPGRVVNYKQLLDDAIALAAQPVRCCVIQQREQAPCQLVDGRDIEWQDFIRDADAADCVAVAATDPLYILYTSGTTGKPKGIVRDNGGHAVALRWTMKNLYQVEPGEVYWAASDIGWVVGHSYIVYAPLLNRNTTVLYEGKPVGTPDAGAFWRVISEHRVCAMFTAPTALRAIKKEDPDGRLVRQYDLSCLRTQFLAGERSDPDTIDWAQKHLQVPVIDHWWQTETAWAIATNPIGIEAFPIKPGSATLPAPGYQLQVLSEDGSPVPPDTLGNLAVKLPLPPGTFPSIWGDRQRMADNYLNRYPGYYLTGDSGTIDKDGYVHIMSRIDDVINVAAHRLSTGQMEESLCRHPDVAEAAVFGIADDFKGELPLGLVVLNNTATRPPEEITRELIARVREDIGAVAAFKLVATVSRLPKTRSGKILRATMRKIANREEYTVPPTIDDASILAEIEKVIGRLLETQRGA